MKLKTFFILFKGFSTKKIIQIFLEDEGTTLNNANPNCEEYWNIVQLRLLLPVISTLRYFT